MPLVVDFGPLGHHFFTKKVRFGTLVVDFEHLEVDFDPLWVKFGPVGVNFWHRKLILGLSELNLCIIGVKFRTLGVDYCLYLV